MTEHPNIELARRGYEAFAKGDLAALTELLANDVVWHVQGGRSAATIAAGIRCSASSAASLRKPAARSGWTSMTSSPMTSTPWRWPR